MFVSASPTSPDDIIRMIVDAVRRHLEAGEREELWFAAAVNGLVTFHASTAAGERPSSESTAALRDAARWLLHDNRIAMSLYALTIDNFALRAARDGWLQACVGRSALQYLVDDFPDLLVNSVLEPEYLLDIDIELREAAPEVSPPPAEMIPPGTPRSHWWWWAPSAAGDWSVSVV